MSYRLRLERRARGWLLLFVSGLVLSGVTAFPLEFETRWLAQWFGGSNPWAARACPALAAWIDRVRLGVSDTYGRYPFMAYGTDWLAFAHLVIATAFWGPVRDPARNRWVVEWGMIACVGVAPLAWICGGLRGIPWGWRLIDTSFGVLGLVPLWIAHRAISELERHSTVA